MKITVDEEQYELLMIDYQITEISRLNQVLKNHGIDDQGLRRAICGEFADSNGSFCDRGWLNGEAQGRFWPELLFSRRVLDSAEGLSHMEELIIPEYASNFHEYVTSAIEYYFDESEESLTGIQVGEA